MSTIKPRLGRVHLTDRAPYRDASDHNLLAAQIELDPATVATVATFNVRLRSMDKVSPDWANRRAKCAAVLAASRASVIALQECEADQATYLLTKMNGTGSPWRMVRPSNVCIMYRASTWEFLADRRLIMDNGDEADRRFLALLLRHKGSRRAFWFGNCHLGVGLNLAVWRRHQARKIVEQLRNTPRKATENLPESLFGDITQRSVVMGDFNDWAQHDAAGVRQVFAGVDMFELRVRLSDEAMAGDRWRTNHDFGKATLADARQIDAIFTPR
jgi:endonuclease/exonuclease/phosphatase family metal-dependent hydrolase